MTHHLSAYVRTGVGLEQRNVYTSDGAILAQALYEEASSVIDDIIEPFTSIDSFKRHIATTIISGNGGLGISTITNTFVRSGRQIGEESARFTLAKNGDDKCLSAVSIFALTASALSIACAGVEVSIPIKLTWPKGPKFYISPSGSLAVAGSSTGQFTLDLPVAGVITLYTQGAAKDPPPPAVEDFEYLDKVEAEYARDAYQEVKWILEKNPKAGVHTAWFDIDGTLLAPDNHLIGKMVGTMKAFRDAGKNVGIFSLRLPQTVESFLKSHPRIKAMVSTGPDGRLMIRDISYLNRLNDAVVKWAHATFGEYGVSLISLYDDPLIQCIRFGNEILDFSKLVHAGEILFDNEILRIRETLAGLPTENRPFLARVMGLEFDRPKYIQIASDKQWLTNEEIAAISGALNP